ncbi:MAG: hypothetical protein GWN58_03490, partial [Anaerolineae bacterium]|nr:hypothetical protein [Anaerolineae bacterium]
GYYAAYPVVASTAMRTRRGGLADFVERLAELSQQPAVTALEWVYTALPLLLLPFFVALWCLLGARGQRAPSALALGLGLLSIGVMALSYTFNPTALHALARAYTEANSQAEAAVILSTTSALLAWMRGLNQLSSLLYQACVALFSLALIRSRTWRGWGWLGLAGAILALPAKLSLGLSVPTNAIWTGLAYGVWPLVLGVGLLRAGSIRESRANPRTGSATGES